MSLWLIRHGQTPLNAARVLQPADTPLSAHGILQAQALGRRLAAERFAGLVASDMPRAQHTAQIVGAACALVPRTSTLLHERNFGDLRGQPWDRLNFDPLAAPDAPPGGETAAAFAVRCDAAWSWLLAEQAAAGGPLLVVTHGLVIRQWLLHGPLSDVPGHPALPALANTSVTVAEAAAPHRVSLVNCILHLDGLSAEGAAA